MSGSSIIGNHKRLFLRGKRCGTANSESLRINLRLKLNPSELRAMHETKHWLIHHFAPQAFQESVTKPLNPLTDLLWPPGLYRVICMPTFSSPHSALADDAGEEKEEKIELENNVSNMFCINFEKFAFRHFPSANMTRYLKITLRTYRVTLAPCRTSRKLEFEWKLSNVSHNFSCFKNFSSQRGVRKKCNLSISLIAIASLWIRNGDSVCSFWFTLGHRHSRWK